MIALALVQAVIVAAIGWMLWIRKRRVMGGVLVALGLAIAALALVGLARFSP